MEPDLTPPNSSNPLNPPTEPEALRPPMAGTGRTIMPPPASEEPSAPAISQTFTPASTTPAPPPPFTPADPAAAPVSTTGPVNPAQSTFPPAAEPVAPVQPAAPLAAATVGDGGLPTVPVAPVFGAPNAPTAPAKSGRRFPKKLLIGIVAAVLIIGGGAGYYLGYYMNSSVIYSQSLKNTGKGYNKLVTYANQQSLLARKGYSGTGSYKITAGGSSTDGNIGLKSDSQNNGELTFDVGLAATRVNADIRTIKSAGTSPDIYVKASGLKGLGTVLGAPDLDPTLAKLDNTWVVIDHTLIDNLSGTATGQSSQSIQGPTRAQVLDEANAFGKVNQQYVFTTAKDKAVTTIVKKYGTETIDGHKTYHYKVALQKDNVKKYILAQRDALKASSLNDWLKANKYDTSVYDSFNQAADSTKDIKSSDTFDIWMDVSHRMVYKVRFNDSTENPADNYTDVGLDYKGGDTFPFFVAGKSKASGQTTTFSLTSTVNTKSNNMDLKLAAATDGSDGMNLAANLNFKPNTSSITIEKPTGAIPLSQMLSQLGYGDLLGSTGATSDTSILSSQQSAKLSLATAATTKTVQGSLLQRVLGR